LTYAAITARCSPFIEIIAFKHSENKLFHLYTLNFNTQNPGTEPTASYLDLPHSVKLSKDALFMTVTSYNGEVKFFKFI